MMDREASPTELLLAREYMERALRLLDTADQPLIAAQLSLALETLNAKIP